MTKVILVLMAFLALLMAGCISLETNQKVAKDGTSVVVQKIDMSGLVQYAKQMQTSSDAIKKTSTVKPNTNFSLTAYASMPKPEDMKIVMEAKPQGTVKADSGFNSLSVYIINNNNYTLKNLNIALKGYAFVESSSMATTGWEVGAKDDYRKNLYYGVADVPEGSYPLVVLVTYYDESNTKKTVAMNMDVAVEKKYETASSVANVDSQFGEICTNATRMDSSLKCEYDPAGVLTFEKSVKPEDAGYTFKVEDSFPYKVYVFSTDVQPQLMPQGMASGMGSTGTGMLSSTTALSGKQTKFTDPMSKASALMLKGANVKMTYTVEMPGELVSAENGEIKDGKASYNVLELMENGKAVEVRSRELDMVTLGIAAVAIVVVVGAGAFLLVFGRKTPAK